MPSEHFRSESEKDDYNNQSGSDTEKRVKVFDISTLPWRSAELGYLTRRLV